MIREFLNCAGTRERIDFLTKTSVKDWSQEDLTTVMNILGISPAGVTTVEQKVAAVEKHLVDYHCNVECKEDPQFKNVDEIPVRNEKDKPYEQIPIIPAIFDIRGN